MVFEWAVISLDYFKCVFKKQWKIPTRSIYVEVGRSMSEKSTCNLRKNNVLVIAWNRRKQIRHQNGGLSDLK